MASAGDAVLETAEAILRYLAARPDAGDTLVGILTWWLHTRHSATEVQQALDWLVHRGLVLRSVLPDGQVMYARAGDPIPPGQID